MTTPEDNVIDLAAARRARIVYCLPGFMSQRKAGYFCVEPEMLTPYERARLRQRAKENAAYYRRAFAALRLKAPPGRL